MTKIPILFELLKERGISHAKLSADTGISAGNISDWKSGRSKPSAERLMVLSQYLNVTVDYLLGRTDTPELNSYTSINQSNVNSDNSTVNVNADKVDKDTLELIKMINDLSLVQKAEIILKINEMKNK